MVDVISSSRNQCTRAATLSSTYSATLAPITVPSSVAFRKWMPAKILAFLTSSSADEKLRNVRVTPSIVSEDAVKRVLSPNRSLSTAAAALLMHEWPDGYSGCPGVANNGVQLASSVVAGLPSV